MELQEQQVSAARREIAAERLNEIFTVVSISDLYQDRGNTVLYQK